MQSPAFVIRTVRSLKLIMTSLLYTTPNTLGPTFHARYLDSWNSATGAPKKVGSGKTSRRQRSKDVSFGIGTLLVVEQSTWEKRPRGVCDAHRRIR